MEEILNQENLEEFILNLCKEFMKTSERLEDFFEVFRVLINTCAEKVLKELLNSNNFRAVLKALELDPELKGQATYVQDVNACVFNNLLDVGDEQFLELVQLNFRIQTFKELLVTKTFDERLGVIFGSFQSFINEEIVKLFCNSGEIRAGLVIKLKKNQALALEFLRDLLKITSSVLSPAVRCCLYEALVEDEIFGFFPVYWSFDQFTEQERAKTNKIIIKAICEIFPVMPWNFKEIFVKNCPSNVTFFEELACQGMDYDIENVQVLGDFLKSFLESIKELDFTQLSDIFFNQIIKSYEKKLKDPQQSEWSKCEILSLLLNSIQIEPVQSRFDFVLSGILDTLYKILHSETPTVRLAIYKFYKQIIKSNDCYLITHFIKSAYFVKVFEELSQTLLKENMIFSSTLSILNEISISSNIDLLGYVNSSFIDKFHDTSICGYFTKIQARISALEEIPRLDRFNSLDLAARENLLDIPETLKPTKRTDSSSLDPIKILKLN